MSAKSTGIALVSVLVAVLLCGAGAPNPARAATDPILSAAEIDYPPFCIVDADGQAGGFSVELMRAALAAMGRQVTFRTGTWARVRGWLERGEIQALPLVGRTPEREALFDFTVPYMTLYGAIVVRADTADIRYLNDLRGRTVAVMKGDNAEEFLRRRERGIDIRTTDTFEDALRGLAAGRCDAVVIQRLVALRLIQETGLTNIKVVPRPIEDFRQDFCFAVREGDRDTLALLNEGLTLVMADGTYRHLHAKWFAALELPTHRRIVVGGDHNYPPYEYLDENGRPTGYNVDLTRAIAREMDLDIEIRLMPWPRVVDGLKSGDIDILQGMFYSPQRDLEFDFTPPHIITQCVSVVRRGQDPPPTTVGELAGLRIVVERGDIMHQFAVENGLQADVVAVGTQEDALREVAEGRQDCALVSRLTALYWIEAHGWDNLAVARRPLLAPNYCFAVPNGHKAMLATFSEGLKTLENSGEYQRIYDKWLGVYASISPEIGDIVRGLAAGTAVLLAILLAMFAWTRVLRRQVANKTAELRHREAFQRAMITYSPLALFSIDLDGIVSSWNPSAERMFGWTAREVLGKPLPIVPEDSQPEFDVLRRQVAEGGQFSGRELVHRRRDGTPISLSLSVAPIRDRGGRIIGIMTAAEDITERKQAEDALRESEQQLHAILESGANPTVVYDAEGFPQYLNAAFTGVFGWTREELAGQRIPFVPDDQKEVTAAKIKEIYATGDPVKFANQRLTKDGRRLDVIVSAAIIKTAEGRGTGMVVSLTDVSEQKNLELQLRQAQKMESVGRLAGGVAHDFNNMLGVILGYAELALDKVDRDDPLHADLTEIINAARRSADITRQLLAFARRQTIAPKVLDLNDTVEGMLRMLRRLIGEDIDLQWLPDGGLWPVKIDPSQVDQLLANLCVNARDAIAGVGKITIETENVHFDPQYCRDHLGFTAGDYVLLAVSDDGCGMDAEIRDHLFEPFFTTKDAGQGTGLGLATVYGIVKQNNGFINVYSEPGAGTTVKIYLPRHSEAAEALPAALGRKADAGRGETILVVEDEAAVLKLACAILEGLGYTVLAAAGTAEAITLAEAHGAKIHLLITDVVMPEMNGRDLAARLQKLYPDLKVLFMSGYTANVIAHHGVLENGVHFIQKPFSRRDLAARVREALG
jgi:two-component system sensor histidine kinase EvgS